MTFKGDEAREHSRSLVAYGHILSFAEVCGMTQQQRHVGCLRSAFKLYDHDGTGSISQPNLRKVPQGIAGHRSAAEDGHAQRFLRKWQNYA